ncbi:hypothetical protein E1264_27400 [Actinomadura sp. KC216]|uniref:hypothetical protein n=1 Tax=Actinomadura sp. KC216 TaxID=2530370 RepID=UPI0010473FDB|nr:hypothetical protein [Actinomadura sp. KC216]TDB83700.1 hypothetical protein E1264_27400 [Actinomadura sp. KC216]
MNKVLGVEIIKRNWMSKDELLVVAPPLIERGIREPNPFGCTCREWPARRDRGCVPVAQAVSSLTQFIT